MNREVINNSLIEVLEGRTILVTGATGLIGKALVEYLVDIRKLQNLPLRIIVYVRDRKKAATVFGKNLIVNNEVSIVEGFIEDKPVIEENIDYIIHAASQTSSKEFMQTPVETALTSLYGTINMLKLAYEKKVRSFVFLSTMEVYGAPQTDDIIYETHGTDILTMNVRSCYPESKRMCENLCASYASEYGVPAKVIRLTQSFGKGVIYSDGRVFAEFARCTVEKRDIVLRTKGETKRSYISVTDAVNAIFVVLINGTNGEAYNAANEKTYCTIREMADLVAEKIAGGKISVVCQVEEDIRDFGYAPTLHMNLNTEKLKNLGWDATQNLFEMYEEMLNDWKDENEI